MVIQSVKFDKERGVMTIEAKYNRTPEPSASGKTLLVATTRGSETTDTVIDGKDLIINLNAYVYAQAKPVAEPVAEEPAPKGKKAKA